MNMQEKLTQLKALLGDPELVNTVMGQADNAEKQADAMGISFKEAGVDLGALEKDPAALLEFAIKNFETAEKEAEKAAKVGQEEPDDKEEPDAKAEVREYKMGDVMKMLGTMDGRMEKMMGMLGQRTKDDGTAAQVEAVTEAQEITADRLTTLESAVKEADVELPRGLSGQRPTESAATVKEEAEAVIESQKAANGVPQGGFDGFMDFVVGGVEE